MAPKIDTRNVTEFRRLRFDSIDDCSTEVNRILAADQAGKLRHAGNWTPGQIMAHVAAWIEYGYTGYPVKPPPFFVRWILRMTLRKILRDGMSPGVRIPGIAEGTVGMDETPTDEAGKRLLNALQRLKNGEAVVYDSPAFGSMSDKDRVMLNLRHAELHLGFLSYEPTSPESFDTKR